MKKYVFKLEEMLKDGFTEKFAKIFLEIQNKDYETSLNKEFIEWAHSKGFFAKTAVELQLNENNVNDYLSDYDYYRTFPNDSWLKMWHNDKLTLKYMLLGTEFEKYMPKYYYYTLPDIHKTMKKHYCAA